MTNDEQHEQTSEAPASALPGISLWPGLVIVMLVSQVILMLVMVYLATSDRSFAVEPDYYQKALHWDDITAQRRASAQLGWSANVTVSEQADIFKNRDITCSITDETGKPISDARVDIVAFPHARGSKRTALALDPKGQGQYHSRTRISRPGLWEFRIVVRRGDVTFVQVQEIKVVTAGDAR